MGAPSHGPGPVKLVASLIYRGEAERTKAERLLVRKYGPLEPLEKSLPFDYTDYYYPEFGKPLMRRMVCFRKLTTIEDMAGVKTATNAMEKRLCVSGRRTVNIDPGYVNDAKLVLLTTKDHSHRIYIGKRMFAEGTLYFQGGTFRPWPWTYRDYASQEMIEYFNAVREIYMRDTKERKK